MRGTETHAPIPSPVIANDRRRMGAWWRAVALAAVVVATGNANPAEGVKYGTCVYSVYSADMRSKPELGSADGLRFVRGGDIKTVYRRLTDDLPDMVKDLDGDAGITGAYFTGPYGGEYQVVGPVLSNSDDRSRTRSFYGTEAECVGRPVVFLCRKAKATEMFVLPYFSEIGKGTPQAWKERFRPGITDVFMGGAWLVKAGKARSEKQIAGTLPVAIHRFPRKQCAFGIDNKGRFAIVTSDGVLRLDDFARRLKKLGLMESVLLDSGLSSALIWKGQLVAGDAKRPIAHALVLGKWGRPTL